LLEEPAVFVDKQDGTLISGEAGTATFSVTTFHIANLDAKGTIQWYTDSDGKDVNDKMCCIDPSISAGNADRILTMSISPQVGVGTYYFRVTIDGVQSNVATLAIEEKTVTVGEQSGTIIAEKGKGGTATFTVTTTNIADTKTGEVHWWDANANDYTPEFIPSGINPPSISTGNATRILTITTMEPLKLSPGTYYFRVTIDGVQSNMGTLVIEQ
jgi:hypothetical protein